MNPGRTFLIVDDDEDARFLTRHALEQAFPGVNVLEADTTDSALRAAAGETLDGVITDHHLGTCGGDAFVRDLRAGGAQCPIVMVTASCDPKVHRRAYEAGAAAVFVSGDERFIAFFRAPFRHGR